jgi:hypothetical protein
MTEPRKTKHTGEYDEEFASTSNDEGTSERSRSTADDRHSRRPAPQGGKGTPSQAEGDRDKDE